MSPDDSLPDDVETLKAMLIAAQAACLEAQAKARNPEAEARARALLIEQMNRQAAARTVRAILGAGPQFRPILQFSAGNAILNKGQSRLILRREVARGPARTISALS